MANDGQCTVASRLLEVLAERGVRYLFGNVGTDWAPVIEAMSSAQAHGRSIPEPLPLAHEGVAVGMAHGYYLATGVPQAVGVHVNVGLANAAMGALNAARSNVPFLLLARLTPVTEEGRPGSRTTPIHWGQDMFDQTSLVREAVKWHRDLHVGAQVDDVIDRALSIASSAPAGPVYVGLPREVLDNGLDRFAEPDVQGLAVSLCKCSCAVKCLIIERDVYRLPLSEFLGGEACQGSSVPPASSSSRPRYMCTAR
jgi:acetolactate synthase I/II/III large subunit